MLFFGVAKMDDEYEYTEDYEMFPTAEECAASAAPVFAAEQWEWACVGIPDEAEILKTLRGLMRHMEEDEAGYVGTGRLIFTEGRFGHERGSI
jgi:hypothetical protein